MTTGRQAYEAEQDTIQAREDEEKYQEMLGRMYHRSSEFAKFKEAFLELMDNLEEERLSKSVHSDIEDVVRMFRNLVK